MGALIERLLYAPPDEMHAQYLERQIESNLEGQILHFRAHNHQIGVQRLTRFNRVIADRLGGLLDEFEKLASCRRITGSEAIFPLRCHAAPPANLQDIQNQMQEIERDFSNMGTSTRSVLV